MNTTHLPKVSAQRFSCNNNEIPQTQHKNLLSITIYEWPRDSLTVIKDILVVPIPQPKKSAFKFDTTSEAAEHNWTVLQGQKDLGAALHNDDVSPLGSGSEF